MSIEEKVISIVSEVLGIESEKITSADTFDDLYADSLDLVEITIECEKGFNYPITDDYLESTQADLQVDE